MPKGTRGGTKKRSKPPEGEMVLKTTLYDEYDGEITEVVDIVVGNTVVGEATLQYSENDDMVYLSRIDIEPEYQGQGLGTKALEILARGRTIYFAPDNRKAQRLYKRIAYEFWHQNTDHHGYYVDQGFGVYMM